MKTIITDSFDARYNLALEEHILKNRQEEHVFLWQSDNSVIIGKNQNTTEEINAEYVEEHKVNVVRRNSGGGAVYHDSGNINFSFITNVDDKINTISKFTNSVIEALKSYGVPAEFSGKNDILVNGMKISGSAQAIHGKRILYHGTLLFNSDLTKLGKILKPKMDKLISKGVASVESRVTNILLYIKEQEMLTIDEFKMSILKKLLQIEHHDVIEPYIYELSENDKDAINDLVKNKYSTDAWNYGEIVKPEFNIKKYCRYEGRGSVTFQLNIIDGKITNVNIFGDFLGYGDLFNIENALKNVKFQRDSVKKKLQRFNLKKYFGKITLDNILDCLFESKIINKNKNDYGVTVYSLYSPNEIYNYGTFFASFNNRTVFVEYASWYQVWYEEQEDGTLRIGLTLSPDNDLVDIRVKVNINDTVNNNDLLMEIEMVKSSIEVLAPFNCRIIKIDNQNIANLIQVIKI
jgi:lipoate-protein ligase A